MSGAPSRREYAASLSALLGALVVNYFATARAEAVGATAHPSPDLLFRLLPRVDLLWIYLWGFAGFIALAVAVAVRFERERIPHIARMFAGLILLRAFLMLLTPMRLPDDAIPMESEPLFRYAGRFLTAKHDLFFSSHTAMPFLAALVYRTRAARAAFLAISIAQAAAVLLGRLHYSIDVAGAYFITYAVVQLQRRSAPSLPAAPSQPACAA